MSRKVLVAGLVGVMALFAAASLAWACTTFSRLDLGSSTGRPGAEVAVRGTNAAANSPVALRWNSRTAPVVAKVTADATGSFTTMVKVPESAPLGVHVLLGLDGNGELARGALEVVGPAGERASTEPIFRAEESAGATNSLQIGTGLLALAALAVVPVLGIALLVRHPALARAGARRSADG